MKTLCVLLFILLAVGEQVWSAVTWSSVSETQFANVSMTDRSWNGQLIEQGAGYEIGIGNGNFASLSDIDNYSWMIGTSVPFRMNYSFGGVLTLSLNNSIPIVEYRPVGATVEIWLGNRNISGAPFQSLTLQNLFMNGTALPTLVTIGNPNSDSEFQGIALSGFPSEFTLEGDIIWNSTVGDLAFNGSSAMLMGVNRFTGAIVPELSSSFLILLSASTLFLRRTRH